MTNIQFIAKYVSTEAINIQNTVQLLKEDCRIHYNEYFSDYILKLSKSKKSQ